MEWLWDVICGVKIAWTSPEFDWLRWILVGVIIAGPLGYLARMDAEAAAREDDNREWPSEAAIKDDHP